MSSLFAEAIFPHISPALLKLQVPSDIEGLADLFSITSRAGYIVRFDNGLRETSVDFYDRKIIDEAFAADIARFCTSSFQSICSASADLTNTELVPWSLIRSYYAAFYSGHAIIRMLGESCTYLQQSQVSRITTVANAMGAFANFRLERGVYHFSLKPLGSALTFKKAGGTNAGSHEVFWKIFLTYLRNIQGSVLQGPLTPTENSAVFLSLNDLTSSLNNESWLSHVRNDLQYRHGFRAWLPTKISNRAKQELSSAASSWLKDPMKIKLDGTKTELQRFLETCSFIVALCRALVLFISERSDVGARCFTASGPMKFLKEGGYH